MISDQALKEFKDIWKDELGEVPSDEIVLDEAINLLNAFNHIYRPVKKDWFNKDEKV